MEKEHREKIYKSVLGPVAWLYGTGVNVRNRLFDWKILKEQSYEVPVVCVGNLTVGGTGKTPLVEYIVENLCQEFNIAVLSRGYKRMTKGFVLANEILSPRDIGDEPYQIYRKFGRLITLAVCEDRRRGIAELLNVNPQINLILLDDAFQHRYVKPKVSVVLADYNRPIFNDQMLPIGNLREPWRNVLRSDIVVVTKCPSDIKDIDFRIWKKGLDLYPEQSLLFSEIQYANPLPIFPIQFQQLSTLRDLHETDSVLAVTGIAQPRTFVRYLRQWRANVQVLRYDDHHYFSRSDFDYIKKRFDEMKGRRKFIITTEKDSVRILNNPYFPTALRTAIYYVPIKVHFLRDDNFMALLKQKILAGNPTK